MKTPAPISPRLFSIQALRGFAATFVVFMHLNGIEGKHSPDTLLPDLTLLGMSGVDLFFVISGFIMVWVTKELGSTGKGALKFLYARLTRIYPLYWAIMIALFLAWSIKPSITDFDPNRGRLLKSFMLWPDVNLPMLKVGWTLIHELYFYLVFALLICLPKTWRLFGLTLWATLVIFGNLAGLGILSAELRLIFNPLGLDFFFGALMATLLTKTQGQGARAGLVAGLALWACALIHHSQTGSPPYPSDWQRALSFGIPASLVLYGCVGVERHGRRVSKWMVTLGDWSYSLYLSHILTLSVLGYIWRIFAAPGWIDNAIALPVMALIAIFVSGAIYHLIERPALRLTKALGKRFTQK